MRDKRLLESMVKRKPRTTRTGIIMLWFPGLFLKAWLDSTRTLRTPALVTLILPVSSFYLRKNKKQDGRKERNPDNAIPFVLVREVRG
jgi:hypothetical protein